MKTTLELPGATLRRAKNIAASRGITLNLLLEEALEEKLRRPKAPPKENGHPRWLKFEGAFGKTAADRAETSRIQRVIDEEFERIDE